jgi:hypothetical protein
MKLLSESLGHTRVTWIDAPGQDVRNLFIWHFYSAGAFFVPIETNRASGSYFDAFSSREPVPTSLEIAAISVTPRDRPRANDEIRTE